MSDIKEEGKEYLIRSLYGFIFIENIHRTWYILSQGLPDI
jgi:hypothetical protein